MTNKNVINSISHAPYHMIACIPISLSPSLPVDHLYIVLVVQPALRIDLYNHILMLH